MFDSLAGQGHSQMSLAHAGRSQEENVGSFGTEAGEWRGRTTKGWPHGTSWASPGGWTGRQWPTLVGFKVKLLPMEAQTEI